MVVTFHKGCGAMLGCHCGPAMAVVETCVSRRISKSKEFVEERILQSK